MEFGYFMSGDVKHYERSIYTALDLFGDVGGLFEALKVLASIIMFVAQIIIKGGPQNYIIPRLFKRAGATPSTSIRDTLQQQISSIETRQRLEFHFLTCLRRRDKRFYEKAINRTSKELDIVNYFKFQKILRMVHKHIFTDLERYLLASQRCFVIDSLSSSKSESDSKKPNVNFGL